MVQIVGCWENHKDIGNPKSSMGEPEMEKRQKESINNRQVFFYVERSIQITNQVGRCDVG
jgi:hypothetical protein